MWVRFPPGLLELNMFDGNKMDKEVRDLWAELSEEQKQDGVAFADELERRSGMFGCPQLWTIYRQAWLLHLGHKLEYCSHETAEGLLGRTAGCLAKLHGLLKGKSKHA